jgi:hypothetical protein
LRHVAQGSGGSKNGNNGNGGEASGNSENGNRGEGGGIMNCGDIFPRCSANGGPGGSDNSFNSGNGLGRNGNGGRVVLLAVSFHHVLGFAKRMEERVGQVIAII